MKLFDLTGKVALVTGGNRGLGFGVAKALAEAGADIAVSSRSGKDESVREAVESAGRKYLYIKTDLASREERAKLIPAVVENFGRLDILVNNAGITYRQESLDFPLERWDEIIEVMATAVFELCQSAARVMVKQGAGKIINVASLLSFQGGWTTPAYAAAKHAVAGITKALANEWASKGIQVNAIAPGYFNIGFTRTVIEDPVRGPQILARIPAGRWGEPQDLAGAVIFLASEASEYVNGHILVVDGGWMGR